MNIRRSFIGFIIIVAVMIVLVLWLGKKKSAEMPLAAASPTTNATLSAVAATSSQANRSVQTNVPPAQFASASAPTTTSQHSPPLLDRVAVLKEFLQANDADIVFYGRLEDQFSNAVGNAVVNFSIRYENLNGRGVQRGQITADENGSFKISGYRGQDISVVPEKAGYVPLEMKGSGNYSPALYPEGQRAHPDPNNPVVITMWKLQGGEHLIHFQTESRVPLDGAVTTFDLQTGRQVKSSGDVIVSVKSSPTPNIREEYDWQVTIQAIDGGFISSSDDFEKMFQAPDSGYEAKLDINFQKGTRQWTSRFNGIYYFTSRNGSCYGKVGIEVLSDVVKNGTVPMILNSYVNPAGSRNLEIDPKLVTEASP